MSGVLREVAAAFGIVVLCIVAAVTYGVLHDQVTARVSIEYFTVGHTRLFETDLPTLHALAWGVIATWWVGAILGVGLAIAARAGTRPRRSIRSLVRPIVTLLLVIGSVSLVAGVVGFALAEAGAVKLLEPIASRVAPARHVRYLTALWAHSGAYGAGFLGGAALWIRVWRRRGSVTTLTVEPTSRG